ncbi:MAG: hypothetical protein IKP00_05855 [Victivallales bacterium]|nr:hypothetical protein [Victivallales bacterium]
MKGTLAILFLALMLRAADMPAGVKKMPDGTLLVAGITIRPEAKELAFPAEFNLEAGALEVIIAQPHGRVHEALLVTKISALQIQAMLYALGAKNGSRLPGQATAQGTLVDIFIEWKDEKGLLQRKPVEEWMLDRRTGKPADRQGWTFVGSVVKEGRFLADAEGNVVLNYSVGSTILDIPDKESLEDDTLHTVNTDLKQPDEVTVVFKPRL